MKCPNCNFSNEQGTQFCRVCGTRLNNSDNHHGEETRLANNNETPKEVEVSKDGLPLVRRFEIGGVLFNMILVEGGTFWMGEQNVDPRKPNYDPEAEGDTVRRVSVDAFYIGETVVTMELYWALLKDDGSYFRRYGYSEKTPYNHFNASFRNAKYYVSELMAQTGEFFRIPTEAEWEFAARGGNKSKKFRFSGSNVLNDVGWYYNNRTDCLLYEKILSDYQDERRIPPNVMMKKPNEIGLYDMSGLIFELCETENGREAYRGGSCESVASECRVAYYSESIHTSWSHLVGIRLAMTPKY